MSKPNNQNPMINVTGLWLNTDKNDQQYMAGNCGGVRYWVFKNKHKEKEGDPDYLLKLSQNLKPKKDDLEDDDDFGDVPF